MQRRGQNWLDGVAVGASAACLVHCLALPLLIAALPVLAGMLAIGEGLHAIIFAAAVPTSALALFAGHRRHGQLTPVAGSALGLTLLASGLLAGRPLAETALTVAGSLLLASAHLMNWRLQPRG